MAAIITDQIRILNAKNFVAGVQTSTNAYYSFIGLPNATDIQTDWDTSPPSPKDNFNEENNYWDTIIALKKITSTDVRQVVQKRSWTSGTTYDMYRSDYSRSNTAAVSGATNLYSATFYVINSDYRVYACLQNGMDPDNPNGKPSFRYRIWKRVTWLNGRHMMWAWISMIWVAFTDIYIRMVASGSWVDINTWTN